MKKILAAALTFIIIISLSACLGDTALEDTAATEEPTASPTEEEPTATPTPDPTIIITATPEPSATEAPTEEPTAAPVSSVTPEAVLDSGTDIYAYGGMQGTIYFDLDSDGTEDEITYEFWDYYSNSPTDEITLDSPYTGMDYDLYQCNLSVNGQPVIVQGDMLAGIILIVDIDSSDGQYEIAVPEFGPSDDPFTTFIAYNGIAPYSIGKVYSNPFYDLTVDGMGAIIGTKRGNILHTWFYEATYTLEESLITEQIDGGYVYMDTDVTALIDLPLQMSPEDSTIAFTLSVGESGTITWTDDESWCCVETPAGLVGWFQVTGVSIINGQDSFYVLNGLSFAD